MIITIEKKASKSYIVRRYGYAFAYIKMNAANTWYLSTTRISLSAEDLRDIAKHIDILNGVESD